MKKIGSKKQRAGSSGRPKIASASSSIAPAPTVCGALTGKGREVVVKLAEELYNRPVNKSRQPKSLVDFFRQSPARGLDLDLSRDPSPVRKVNL